MKAGRKAKAVATGPVDSQKRELVELQLKRFFARYSANRHLHAYLIDRNPKHIAAAWRAFRKHKKVTPDESMMLWIDCLAEAVLNPTAAKLRPKENTVRDLDILRDVHVLQRKHGNNRLTRSILDNVSRKYGVSAAAVKMIVSRAEQMLRDPYYTPRAFRK